MACSAPTGNGLSLLAGAVSLINGVKLTTVVEGVKEREGELREIPNWGEVDSSTSCGEVDSLLDCVGDSSEYCGEGDLVLVLDFEGDLVFVADEDGDLVIVAVEDGVGGKHESLWVQIPQLHQDGTGHENVLPLISISNGSGSSMRKSGRVPQNSLLLISLMFKVKQNTRDVPTHNVSSISISFQVSGMDDVS